jgi:hypothetical protein
MGSKDPVNGFVSIYNKTPTSGVQTDLHIAFPNFQIDPDLYDNEGVLDEIVSKVLQSQAGGGSSY